jgi:hypothetical protein
MHTPFHSRRHNQSHPCQVSLVKASRFFSGIYFLEGKNNLRSSEDPISETNVRSGEDSIIKLNVRSGEDSMSVLNVRSGEDLLSRLHVQGGED